MPGVIHERQDLTPAQIDAIADRGVKFVGTLSQVPPIRAPMARGGYTAEEHARGWELVLDVIGYRTPIDAGEAHVKRRQAIAELDAYDGPSFDRARAALDRQFPEQSRYVFDGLTAKTGAEAIGSVRTFVDRVAALRDGTDPHAQIHAQKTPPRPHCSAHVTSSTRMKRSVCVG